MSGIRYDIETIMEVIERVYGSWQYELTIDVSGVCFITCQAGKHPLEGFNNLSELYRWIAEQQAKLDEQQKALNNQRARDYRDSEPPKHRF